METKAVEATSKLTLKMLGCEPKALLKLEEKTLPLARMYGKASRIGEQHDVERGQTYTYFVGTFEGVNLQDGTFLTAPRLYLPGGISDELEHMVHKAKQRDKGAIVGFVIEIVAVKSTESSSGYIYKGTFLKKPQEHDELAEFRTFAGPTTITPPKDKTTAAAKKSA